MLVPERSPRTWSGFIRASFNYKLIGVAYLSLLHGLLVLQLEGFLYSGIFFGPSQQVSEVPGILLFQGEQKIILLKTALQGDHCNRLSKFRTSNVAALKWLT